MTHTGRESTTASSTVAVPRVAVFSVLAWAIISPFFTTAYGGFEQSRTGEQWLAGFGIAVLVHLLLLPVFVGAGAVEGRLASRVGLRIAWVAFVIVVIALARPMTTSALQLVVGIPPVESPWPLRFLLNAAALTLALLVIHAVVHMVRRRLLVGARLDAVLAESTGEASATAESTDRLVAEYERAVAEPVRRALDAAVIRPLDAAAQAASLRRLAHDVVRPLSHHVFETELAVPAPRAGGARPRGLRIAARVLPAPAWAPALVFAIIMYPTLVIGYGPLGGLVRLGPGIALALLGCLLVGLVRLSTRRRQIAVLMIGYAIVGLGVTAIFLDDAVLPLPPTVIALPDIVLLTYWCYIPAAFVLIAMLLVVARSEYAEAREGEAELARLLLVSQRRAAAARLEHAALRSRLARVLHNQVQGEIIALALRLKLGSAGEEEVQRLRETIDAMLADAVLPDSDADEPVSPATVARNAQLAISSWAQAIEVRSSATPEVWDWLAPRPAAAAVLLDAAVEGLTNAVRHDEAPSASVEFARVADGVRLTLRAPGRLRGAAADGFGLADLRRRGAVVGLEQDGREVVLRVEVVAA